MIIFIDTLPGRGGILAPPIGRKVVGYSKWLLGRYRTCTGLDGSRTMFYGAAQEINSVAYKAKHEKAKLVTVGPYAAEAAEVIKGLFPGTAVEVC